jgi:hypothetical protein
MTCTGPIDIVFAPRGVGAPEPKLLRGFGSWTGSGPKRQHAEWNEQDNNYEGISPNGIVLAMFE